MAEPVQPPTDMAWRHPKRGKAHRARQLGDGVSIGLRQCDRGVMRDWEEVPLSRVAPEDRCRFCWGDESRG